MKEIAVIGGGASGIAAALSAARTDPSAHILLLEGLDRVGKKILVTGNGRCNLTNESIAPAHYHSSSPGILPALLAEMPTARTLDFFRALGLSCAAGESGRIYPYSRQAASVLDVLLLGLQERNVDVRCGRKVVSLKHRKGRFQLSTQSGEVFHADSVVLAVGGQAAPKQGSDGSGYSLAAAFGHSSTPRYPCLVALKCGGTRSGLKGIRAQGLATLFLDGTPAAADRGELQFTDYGLSGIPAFQLSCFLRGRTSGAEVAIDLLPDWEQTALARFLREQAQRIPGASLERFLPGLVHKRLLYAVMKFAGIGPLSRSASSLSQEETRHLAAALKDWRFPITGTLGWDSAQVTGGGIPLEEIDGSFRSRLQSGLYLTGELLDAVGDCGGYNLHWAWCSGQIAGTAAARDTIRQS